MPACTLTVKQAPARRAHATSKTKGSSAKPPACCGSTCDTMGVVTAACGDTSDNSHHRGLRALALQQDAIECGDDTSGEKITLRRGQSGGEDWGGDLVGGTRGCGCLHSSTADTVIFDDVHVIRMWHPAQPFRTGADNRNCLAYGAARNEQSDTAPLRCCCCCRRPLRRTSRLQLGKSRPKVKSQGAGATCSGR